MSQFEDNLWGAVVDRHGDDPARADGPVARVGRPRPRLLAGASVGVAAIATAAVLAVGATTGTPPAFAITRHHDGSVAVTINRRSGIAGANRQLAAMGMRQRVMAVGDDQSLRLSCVAPGPGSDGNSLVIKGYPKVATRPASAGSTTPAGTGTGNTGAGGTSPGGPAVGSTWHVVSCSSLQDTPGTGNTGAG